MKKTDLTQIELLLTRTLDAKLEPIVKAVNSHNQTIEDKETGLKVCVQRHGNRIQALEYFQIEIKAKIAVISGIAGAISSGIVLYAKSFFSSK